MKMHLARIRSNRYGGFNTGSLCGRLNAKSEDGMNLTDKADEVTCKFCRKDSRFEAEVLLLNATPSSGATK